MYVHFTVLIPLGNNYFLLFEKYLTITSVQYAVLQLHIVYFSVLLFKIWYSLQLTRK